MNGKAHVLEIYDTENYEGPNPVRVTGRFIVRGPERTQYYILEPQEPMRYEGADIQILAVRPHYEGDSITNAVESMCTVGIALTRPDTAFEEGSNYGFNDFIFWRVGKMHPNHRH